MGSFFSSFFYFLLLIFKRKQVDVVFYYPQHFNRGKDSNNIFFNHLYSCCKKNNLSFLVFEEPDKESSKTRSKDSIPFDFIYYIIIFLRKFKISDQLIGKILSRTILRTLSFRNYIVLSQSMLSIFRSINPDAKLFDLQHGIIHSNHNSYLQNKQVNVNLKDNVVYLLLNGLGYQDILVKNDESGYYKDHSHVLGIPNNNSQVIHKEVNKNILVTLQFTDDHSKYQNNELLNDIKIFIKENRDYNFYLRNHPRSNSLDISSLLNNENVFPANDILDIYLKLCSLHLTSYSTTVFECAAFGIPTIFLTKFKEKTDIFYLEFMYPINNDLKFIEKNYDVCSKKVFNWQFHFRNSFNENNFLSLLK